MAETTDNYEPKMMEDGIISLVPTVSTEEKIDYIYRFLVQLAPLIENASEQLTPLIEKFQANPMLKMFLR